MNHSTAPDGGAIRLFAPTTDDLGDTIGLLATDAAYALVQHESSALAELLDRTIADERLRNTISDAVLTVSSTMATRAAVVGYALALTSAEAIGGNRAWLRAALARVYPDLVVSWRAAGEAE